MNWKFSWRWTVRAQSYFYYSSYRYAFFYTLNEKKETDKQTKRMLELRDFHEITYFLLQRSTVVGECGQIGT